MSKYTAEQVELEATACLDDVRSAMLRAYAVDLREREAAKESLFKRACEVVHHDHDCPAIGGRGDNDCRCDAVPFLRDLEAVLTASRPAAGEPVAFTTPSGDVVFRPGRYPGNGVELYAQPMAGKVEVPEGFEALAREGADLASEMTYEANQQNSQEFADRAGVIYRMAQAMLSAAPAPPASGEKGRD